MKRDVKTEKIKVNIKFQVGYFVLLFITYIGFLVWDYCVREHRECFLYDVVQLGVFYIAIYYMFIGRMKIEVCDGHLICKPYNSFSSKEIPLERIEYVIKEKEFFPKVVVYYNDGYKVVLHPYNPDEMADFIVKRADNCIVGRTRTQQEDCDLLVINETVSKCIAQKGL